MRLLFLSISLIFIVKFMHSQGCSDAGACSVGSLELKDNSRDKTGLLIGYQQSLGLADKEALVAGTELFLEHRILKNTSLEFRLPYYVTIGNLATTSGVGDLLVSVSQHLLQSETGRLTFITGGRLKTNDADKSKDGEPLPMVYQSSLGTYDIIAGLAWQTKKWSFSVGYQHPFGANENKYLHPDSVELPDNKQYYESAYLKRGDDLMLRIQRTVTLNEKSTINFGFLPIYRIQKDEIKRNGVYEQLPGSSGITYNVFFNWYKKLGQNKQFVLTTGIPVHAREYRADGLTRTAIVSAGLIFSFHQKQDKLLQENMFDSLHQE
ncbi:MAG: hypothetical protein KDC05_01655 [Bacteroidales bacterium]|nr:hypothetical protein [Bacteroidales bacterium]